jgi:hypothetical protein
MPVPLRNQAAGLRLFVIAPNRKEQNVSQEAMASRVRSLMPALGPCLADRYAGDTRIRMGATNNMMAVPVGGDAIASGDRVSARIKAGIFTVERAGVAMQSAHRGERFFMRTRDGAISAQCCEVK